jgi:hypothetical protein
MCIKHAHFHWESIVNPIRREGSRKLDVQPSYFSSDI